jgi:biotin carboxylase
MARNRLLIIAATWEQVPLIRRAREMGHYVVATDPNPEAEGLVEADAHEVVDPRDLPALLEIAKRHDVDAVLADECDYSHYAATYVALRLGLPNDGFEGSQNTTNKFWMRSACAEAGVIQPTFFPCRTADEARRAATTIGFPVVVKPTDNRGAFGVSIARDENELVDAFYHAIANSHGRLVLVESHIDGTHITVDGCFDDQGRHRVLANASKTTVPGPKPVIDRVTYPAAISDGTRAALHAATNQVVEALGMTRGLSHSEFIISRAGEVHLIETANRGGGVLTSAIIVPEVSGVDLSALLIANALGEPYPVSPRAEPSFVVLRFFLFAPGTVAAISGVEDALALPGVLYLRLLISPGDTLEPPDSAAGRHGFAIVRAENAEAADAVVEAVQATISVTYDEAPAS